MRVDAATSIINPQLSGEKHTVSITEKTQWLQSVTDGQILKGRILRHYGEGRYGIDFSGKERVVDSAIPLTVGELLSGKVIGISENSITVQVLSLRKSVEKDGNPESNSRNAVKPASVLETFAEMTQQFSGIKLSESQLEFIAKLASNSAKPELTIQIGLFLSKVGMPVSKELVDSLERRVTELSSKSIEYSQKNIPQLTTRPYEKSVKQDDTAFSQIVNILAQYFSQHYAENQGSDKVQVQQAFLASAIATNKLSALTNKEAGKSGDGKESFSDNNQLLSAIYSHVFNIQTGAAYQHRFETLPIMINDRLLEFDIVFFDHSSDKNHGDVKSRYLKFSLDTEFGEVSLNAQIINNRVSLQVVTDKDLIKSAFEQHHQELSESLNNADWLLESVDYKVGRDIKTPTMKVMEHVLAQESLQVFV